MLASLFAGSTFLYFNNRNFSTVASAQPSDDSHKDVLIDFASELAEGETRELRVGDGKDDRILIANYNG